MKKSATKRVYLPEVVGGGYGQFWRFRGRYRVVKGSRASKKSKTTALNLITQMMKYPQANTLVVRKTFRTLKDSCFTELKWAIARLGVSLWWDIKESPLEMTYRPTGQKIYFRGLDDPLKVTSITVEHGFLCWMWIEEAYEILKESDFDMLDESIRGAIPPETGLFKQITLTFNPWNERHWLKRRFFDAPPSPDILAITTDYRCNEWLDESDMRVFETMRQNNPRRYQVAGLGNWGVLDGLVFENWHERVFTLKDVEACRTVAGLDFGYTNDPSALFVGFLDLEESRLFVWDELYEKGLSNRRIWERVQEMGYAKERITGDCAEPKSIDELRSYGMRIRAARKGKDSVSNGIQWIQDLEIIIHPRCVNFLTEIGNYTWAEDRFGKKLNDPIDDFNHLMDAMRYAVEDYSTGGKRLRTMDKNLL
jgi:phage terminase large subunit